MVRPDIADFLKSLRLSKKLYQSDLALKFGVHHSYISQLETGKRGPSKDILQNYIQEFGLSITDIYISRQDLTALGLELKRLRKKRGMDISTLADVANINFFRLVEIEEGSTTCPTEQEIKRITVALEVDEDHFDKNFKSLKNQLSDILIRLGLKANQRDSVLEYTVRCIEKNKTAHS